DIELRKISLPQEIIMATTSHSEIKLARKCSRAHHYKYIEGLKRKKPSRPAFIGTILHEMIHAFTMAKLQDDYLDDPWKVLERYKKQYASLFQIEKDEYGDVPAIA